MTHLLEGKLTKKSKLQQWRNTEETEKRILLVHWFRVVGGGGGVVYVSAAELLAEATVPGCGPDVSLRHVRLDWGDSL